MTSCCDLCCLFHLLSFLSVIFILLDLSSWLERPSKCLRIKSCNSFWDDRINKFGICDHMSPSNVFITSTADCPKSKASLFCFRAGNSGVKLCNLCFSHKYARSSNCCAQLTTTCATATATTTDASKRFVEKTLWIGDGSSTVFRRHNEFDEYGWVSFLSDL